MDASGMTSLLVRAGMWNGLVCLTYHRIGAAAGEEFDPELWSTSAGEFDTQMRYLKRHYDVITIDDLDDVVGRARRGRHVMVTFDDGYRDNYEVAFPILRSHGLRATFFVATGFIDAPSLSWWDEIAWMVRRTDRVLLDGGRWHPRPIAVAPAARGEAIRELLSIYKRLSEYQAPAFLDHLGAVTGAGRYAGDAPGSMWMTWAMVRELQRAGMAIGGHTVHHPVLARLAPHRQLVEFEDCLRRIEEETGVRPTAASYPVGDPSAYDAVTRACAAAAGVRYAFGFSGGFERDVHRWQPLALRRVAVETEVRGADFRNMLALPQLFTPSFAGTSCPQ